MRIAPWLAAAVASALAAAACFSEHQPATPNDGFDCDRAALPAGPDSAIVVIRGFAFEPATMQVARGTHVIWINCESSEFPGHTTTADAGEWDSPTLGAGDTFSMLTAEPGEYPYHCRLHPFMQARVVVD